MNDWNQTRANVAATFAARFLIHWLKIITYCAFILTDALLICIFSDNFAVIICCERKRRGAYSRRKTRDNWWCKNSVISYYTAILYWGPLPPTLTVFMNAFLENNSGPSISLRASSPGRSGGGAGKGSRAYNYVFGIWISPSVFLWLPVNWAVRFPPITVKRRRIFHAS